MGLEADSMGEALSLSLAVTLGEARDLFPCFLRV